MAIPEDTREQEHSEYVLFSELTKQRELIQAVHTVAPQSPLVVACRGVGIWAAPRFTKRRTSVIYLFFVKSPYKVRICSGELTIGDRKYQLGPILRADVARTLAI